MQTAYKRASVVTGFVILAALLVANAWLIQRRFEIQIADHSAMAHVEQVVLELTETELLLDDAETGQRGFLYTGNPSYLEPYNHAATTIDQHLQTLAKLIPIEDPEQQQRLSRLRAVAHAKLDELHETIFLYNGGKPEEARDLVLSDKGKALMDEIRELAREMEQEETRAGTERAAAYAKSAWLTRLSLYLATVVALLGSALLAYYILRQMDLREEHAHHLREREEWYRVTLTSIGDGVIATDARGTVNFQNPVAEELTGCNSSSAKGKPIAEIFPIFNENTGEPVANPVEKVMTSGHVIGLANHTMLKHRDGRLTPIEDSAAPIRDDLGNLIGVVLVFRDATRERDAQEIVRKAEKLAAAARLASTVAHEINNPLDAVGNLVYLSKSVPGTPAAAVAYLNDAEAQLERVAHITRQTLGFYRESKKWETVDIISLVDAALNLYSNKLQAKFISIEKEYGDCPPLQGSPGELKQVIANLISNASDAVGTHGRLRVSVSPLSSPYDGSSNKQGVQLRIEDDGPGIASENIEKIFEPFFTTKEDVGTGLGLWVTKGIVERHGGTIEAGSGRPGGLGGAVFTVRLPAMDSADLPLAADDVLA